MVMPYGEVEEKLELKVDFPLRLVRKFYQQAIHKFPNECSAWVTFSRSTGDFRYYDLEEIVASRDFLQVQRPSLPDDEILILDIHSHGSIPAFFSGTDNQDDRGEFKIAGVLGNIDTDELTGEFRLCAGGLFIPVKINVSRITD